MIYISLSLRYQRQLNLICPDVVERFFKEASEAAALNGGKVSRAFSGCVFTFDNADLCCVFSVSLTLNLLSALLERHGDRIREFLVFVDFCEKSIPPEQIADRKAVCDNMILPDGCILLNEAAAFLLRHYADCVKIEESPLYFYRRKKGGMGQDVGSQGETLPETLFLYPPPGIRFPAKGSVVSAFLNVISDFSGVFDAESFLLKKEAVVFERAKKACAAFSSMRFSSSHPGFILKGCEEYTRLFFAALSRAKTERKQPKLTTIEIPRGCFEPAEIERFTYVLMDFCVFASPLEGDDAFDTPRPERPESVPADILDAAYLMYRASAFLYRKELDDLFVFLGKNRDFRRSVWAWISACGFPDKTGFLDSVSRLEKEGFPPQENRVRLDAFLFAFLWKKYSDGFLAAGEDFLRAFSGLGQKLPDSFLTATVYRSRNPQETARALQQDFSDPGIFESVTLLEEAEKQLRRGALQEAQGFRKNALHNFQRAGNVAGEYEVFSFSARLSFAGHGVSGGDTTAYLEYAAEDADKMRDPDARMRCLFDFAAVHFLSGNFSAALMNIRKLRKTASAVYDKGWEAVAMFLEGKFHFSIGSYREAEKQFQHTENFCACFDIAKAFPLCRTWASRSRIYQTKNPREYDTLKNLAAEVPEAWLFCLEEVAKTGRIVSGDIQRGPDLSDFPAEIKNESCSASYNFPEAWSWAGSFALAEDRFLCGTKGGGMLRTLYSAFYAYCSSLCGGDLKTARHTIAGCAGDSQSVATPHTFIFHYLCYDIENKISGRNSSDSLAFLSRSFKSMQVVANNISDTAVREKFLQGPYWNALLYAAARENNLI